MIQRPNNERANALLGLGFPVLDSGFVRLVDYMGTDACIEEAARVSYGSKGRSEEETRKLIRYLRSHRHTSPTEMCLSGDTKIPTYPSHGSAVKKYTMRELAEAFSAGKNGAWARLVHIRTLRSDGSMGITRIKRAWSNGVKPVFRVRTKLLGREIVATGNHPFLCEDGIYRKLEELAVGMRLKMNGAPAIPEEVIRVIQERRKQGATLIALHQETGVSTGAIHKFSLEVGIGRVKRKTGFLKKPAGYHSDPRSIARRNTPHARCALCSAPGQDVHHLDENPHNNDETNLVRLCPKHHKHIHRMSVLLSPVLDEIESIEPAGEEEVFDIETVEDTHNFVAEGFIVHNCELKFHCKLPIFLARQWIRHRTASANEMSGRYKLLPTEFYTPEEWRLQSATNKQGSSGEVLDATTDNEISIKYNEVVTEAFNLYHWMTEEDVARELARIQLPLSTYTEWYWKIDLHNLLHFLGLRFEAHAQQEIQDYARVIAGMVAHAFPISWEAFVDYEMQACRFSRMEMDALRNLLLGQQAQFQGTNREWDEFQKKLERPEPIGVSLPWDKARRIEG